MAPREGPGRQRMPGRVDSHARLPRRLRRLARSGQSGLGLRRSDSALRGRSAAGREPSWAKPAYGSLSCMRAGSAESPAIRDSTVRAREGAGFYPVARVNGRRWDATSEFLRPALKRGNLTVWTGVQAARVLIEQGRAAGVEYRSERPPAAGPSGERGDSMRGNRRVGAIAAAERHGTGGATGAAGHSGGRGGARPERTCRTTPRSHYAGGVRSRFRSTEPARAGTPCAIA